MPLTPRRLASHAPKIGDFPQKIVPWSIFYVPHLEARLKAYASSAF